ncbi:MAG: hypothetical protein IBX63_07420 [Coriobacteriia bacterium]|nr:hypothetical protein [Coriobacteriia bacterium]
MGGRAMIGLTALSVALAALFTGCSGPDVTFVSEGSEYTLEQVEALHTSEAPPPSLAGEPVADASELRRDVLVELRSRGDEPAELAEFVTRSLADTGRSVLYYGEAALVEGTSAWILLEVWGAESGTLDSTRLWVFERESGAVVYSSSNR